MDTTKILARYIVSSKFEDIPVPVREEAVRSVVNWTGCAVGGSSHVTVDRAVAALSPFALGDQAALFGRRERFDALHAALINGVASHVLDFDDTHPATLIHPTAPVLPALFALAERQKVSGSQFLHALILGVEVECRIGRAVFPAHYDIGWHITGTAGVFGAAAAVGKLLGLSAQQMVWALGIAGTQSSGFRGMFGSMCKSFHPGRAAQNGLAAAYLAQQNFTSAEDVLEGLRGFGWVMSAERDLDVITNGLGETFEIALNTYKPFPCGLVIHPTIDGCIQLAAENNVIGEEIERIDLRVHPLALELTGKKTPTTGLEGKFSVYHSAAVAMIQRAAGEAQYSDSCVREPDVIALRDRVDAVSDPAVHEDAAYIVVTLKNGKRLEKHVQHSLGSLSRPMSNEALESKFLGLAEPILPRDAVEQLGELCWSISKLDDAAKIVRAGSADTVCD